MPLLAENPSRNRKATVVKVQSWVRVLWMGFSDSALSLTSRSDFGATFTVDEHEGTGSLSGKSRMSDLAGRVAAGKCHSRKIGSRVSQGPSG